MPVHNWLPSAMVAPTPVSALQFVVLLKGQDQAAQMIFKHAISTISPSREVVLPPRDVEA